MRFKSFQIKGKGRGKQLGFPTINLAIPKEFNLKEGIYAVWVKINKENYKGALHFGPVPTFAETKQSLEIYIINFPASQGDALRTGRKLISVEIVKKIRDVRKFNSPKKLIKQMNEDIKQISAIISSHE